MDDLNEIPYIVGLFAGFLLGAYGHAAKSRVLVAVGIIMILVVLVLFQIAIQNVGPETPPPGV